MWPIEPEVCKPIVNYTLENADVICTSIDDPDACALIVDNGTIQCKWEKDYFFGRDDCGYCFRHNGLEERTFGDEGDCLYMGSEAHNIVVFRTHIGYTTYNSNSNIVHML